MRDQIYEQIPYQLSEIEHRYGPNVHVVADPVMLTQLATLCAKQTIQPDINRLVASLYGDLVKMVVNREFPRTEVSIPTRMIDHTPQGIFQGQAIARETRAVVVNIARAGTLPSQVTYDLLNTLLDPRLVRQDHIIMSRLLGEGEQVVGSTISGSKIGGDVDDAIVLIPDPMGATGGSLSTALDTYQKKVPGVARRFVCVNLIVTPEYLRKLTTTHPEAVIYAVRVDRGMSPSDIFSTVPGTHWDRESGLTDKQYIVPGGGGFGEIMNNAYV